MREELSNDRITIRKLIPEYIPLIFKTAYESREELKIWLPWCHQNYNIGETKEWVDSQQSAWNENREFSFGVFEAGSNRFVGVCGINQIDWIKKIGNLGYWVRTDATGKGFASAAAKLCAEFGFIDLRLNRIEIVAAKYNVASQLVAKKTGAKEEYLAKKRLAIGDQMHDAFVYSLLKEDIISNKE